MSEPNAVVAALFVQTNGCYFDQPFVDPWDVTRDARRYPGPYPVVAHPPCERWGRYWSGGPSAKVRRTKGDDNGCFRAAIEAVRKWGGVLEHPEASAAWKFDLICPPRVGGWIAAGDGIGWTCCVEQGHYGHRARKATWLYAAGVTELPSLTWGRSWAGLRLDDGCHTKQERRRRIKLGTLSGPYQSIEGMSRGVWRAATPAAFRDLLLSIARSAGPPQRRGLSISCAQPGLEHQT